MKLHANNADIGMLSAKGRSKLYTWWWSKLDDTDRWVEEDAHRTIGSEIFPDRQWLTIGRLIEYLDEHTDYNWEIRFHKPLYDVNYIRDGISPDFEDYKELFDCLWEVVREVLEQ